MGESLEGDSTSEAIECGGRERLAWSLVQTSTRPLVVRKARQQLILKTCTLRVVSDGANVLLCSLLANHVQRLLLELQLLRAGFVDLDVLPLEAAVVHIVVRIVIEQAGGLRLLFGVRDQGILERALGSRGALQEGGALSHLPLASPAGTAPNMRDRLPLECGTYQKWC